MFTKLFKIRIAAKKRLGCSSNFCKVSAPLAFSSTMRFTLMWLTEVNAVSVAEEKAESTSRTRKPTIDMTLNGAKMFPPIL